MIHTLITTFYIYYNILLELGSNINEHITQDHSMAKNKIVIKSYKDNVKS